MIPTRFCRAIGTMGHPALALFLLAACGGARSSPEGTVQTFLDALDERDSVRFVESFTPETRELVGEIEALTRVVGETSGQPAITMDDWCRAFCGATVEGSTLHGESATVRVGVAGTVEEILVVRQGNEWRIDLVERYRPAIEMLRLIAHEVAAADTAAADAAVPADTATPSVNPAPDPAAPPPDTLP